MVVRVENSEVEVEEWRGATLFSLQTAQHQGEQEITKTDMEGHGSGAGEIEVGVSMAESAPFLSDRVLERIKTDQFQEVYKTKDGPEIEVRAV